MVSRFLKLLLKSSQLPVREYIRNLEMENAKLQKQISKLECANMSHKHKVASLQKELNKYLKKGHLTVVVKRFAQGGT